MFTIRFFTQDYRPDLSVTIRGDVFNDWKDDIPGIYNEGVWVFKLYQQLPNGFISNSA